MRQTQLVLQVPPEVKAAAEQLAAAERRSLSSWLRNVVEDRVLSAHGQPRLAVAMPPGVEARP
jgi:hypothetical protein